MDVMQKQAPTEDPVPTCSTGPVGRIMFVIREISQAIRRHRKRERS